MSESSVSIARVPETRAYNLGIERDGNTFKASWSYPPMASDKQNDARWNKVEVEWWIYVYKADKLKVENAIDKHHREVVEGAYRGYICRYMSFESDSVSGRSFTEITSDEVTLDNGDFYPEFCTGEILHTGHYSSNQGYYVKNNYLYLDKIEVYVYGANKYGRSSLGAISASYEFLHPNPPTPTLSLDKDTGVVTLEIDPGDNALPQDRQTTQYNVSNRYLGDRSSGSTGPFMQSVFPGSYSTDTITVSAQDSKTLNLLPNESMLVVADSNNSGFTGDSKVATTYLYVSWPPKAKIGKYSFSDDNEYIYFPVITNYVKDSVEKYNDPCPQKVTLQRCRSTEYSTAQDVMDSGSWTDVATDDYLCQAFYDLQSEARPTSGTYTWYRIKSEHYKYYRYSDPVCITEWYVAPEIHTAEDDAVFIVDAYSSEEDPARMIVIITWDDDDSTTNEISWAEDTWRWRSDNEPSKWTGQWDSDSGTKAKYVSKYGSSAIRDHVMTANITNVEFGKKYYVRARRVNENSTGSGQSETPSGTTTYSAYALWRGVGITTGPEVPVYVARKPTNLQMTAPTYLPKGNKLVVGWSFESENDQDFWELSAYARRNNTDVKRVLATGTEYTTRSATISEKTIKEWTQGYKERILYLQLSVRAHGTTLAIKKNVSIVVPPTLTVWWNASKLSNKYYLTKQPFTVTYRTNQNDAKIVASIICDRNMATVLPDGSIRRQFKGETLWAGTGKNPLSTDSGATNKVTIKAPFLDFIDGGKYHLEVQATNSYGLSSKFRNIEFEVNWAHKAHPLSASTITGDTGHMAAIVQPKTKEPNKFLNTDVCDIYRVTPDGAELFFRGSQIISTSFNSSVNRWTDRLAPFANIGNRPGFASNDDKNVRLRYRFATRTKDGAICWVDIPYNLTSPNVILNWGEWTSFNGFEKQIDFPYNLVINDQYEKSFETREHLDGTVNGYWGSSVKRTRSISTDVIKYANAEQIEMIRELAHYNGAVFVRTPDGCAFPANVTVSGIDNTYNNPVLAVSLDISEIAMTNAFRNPYGRLK